jgi:hypothetical protein
MVHGAERKGRSAKASRVARGTWPADRPATDPEGTVPLPDSMRLMEQILHAALWRRFAPKIPRRQPGNPLLHLALCKE